jgi:hypothetical protein
MMPLISKPFMVKRCKWSLLAGLCLLVFWGSAFGQSFYVPKGQEDAKHEPLILNLPYAFYNEGFRIWGQVLKNKLISVRFVL